MVPETALLCAIRCHFRKLIHGLLHSVIAACARQEYSTNTVSRLGLMHSTYCRTLRGVWQVWHLSLCLAQYAHEKLSSDCYATASFAICVLKSLPAIRFGQVMPRIFCPCNKMCFISFGDTTCCAISQLFLAATALKAPTCQFTGSKCLHPSSCDGIQPKVRQPNL